MKSISNRSSFSYHGKSRKHIVCVWCFSCCFSKRVIYYARYASSVGSTHAMYDVLLVSRHRFHYDKTQKGVYYLLIIVCTAHSCVISCVRTHAVKNNI